jgi:hypothetical protein
MMMKKILFACACILALSTAGALAQTQPAPGASSEGNVGPGATPRYTATPRYSRTTHHHMKAGVTTGSAVSSRRSYRANPSSEGNVGPGTNNNLGKQPGGR